MIKIKYSLVRIIFLVVTIFLIVVSLFSYVKMENLIDASEWVNHSNIVKLQLETAFSSLKDAESNQRGFILSQDSVFEQGFYVSLDSLSKQLNNIDTLVKDNNTQVKNAGILRELVNKRVDYLKLVLQNIPNARTTIKKKPVGKMMMDDVRSEIAKMNAEEDRLLNERTRLLNQEVFLTPFAIILLFLLSILMLVASYLKIVNDYRASEKLKSELEKTNEVLKQTNEDLQLSEGRYLKIFDNNPVAMTFAEIGNNRFIYANNLFYSTFGYSNEEVIGHTSDELKLTSEEETARLVPIILSYLDDGRTLAELQALSVEETEKVLIKLREKMLSNGFEVLYTKKNGGTFYAMVYYEIIEIGSKKYSLTSYQDVSERKKAANLLEKQNRELVKVNEELESFNYISSHDLQEPLRKIQVLTDRILHKDQEHLSEMSKDYFGRIQRSANHMQVLIKDFLAYSRVNVEEQKFERVFLYSVIEEVKTELKEIIEEKRAIVENKANCEVSIIPFQFHQMMINLIGNALKFSKPEIVPHILIKCAHEKGNRINNENLSPHLNYCHITVSDNGIGFEPQYNERIFEVFQRLSNKNPAPGSGIGLSIVKKIVENHKGIVTATSQLNEGASFDIYIPEII